MRLVAFAYTGVEPHLMEWAPVSATERVLAQTGLTIDEIGLFELNEPFAVAAGGASSGGGRRRAPDDPRLNPSGGAILAWVDPLASRMRLMCQLAFELERRAGASAPGLTALCIGLGLGTAILWEDAAWFRLGMGDSRAQFFLQRVDARRDRARHDRRRHQGSRSGVLMEVAARVARSSAAR